MKFALLECLDLKIAKDGTHLVCGYISYFSARILIAGVIYILMLHNVEGERRFDLPHDFLFQLPDSIMPQLLYTSIFHDLVPGDFLFEIMTTYR